MDSSVDHASNPQSDGGGKSPPADLPPPPPPHPPNASQSLSQPSSDPPSAVENPSSDLTSDAPASDFGNGVSIPIDHDPYTNASPDPYISASPLASDNRTTMETVKGVLSRWSKKVGETAKSAEDLSRNTWQHLKTGPSLVEAAMGRVAQGTKVLAEGGYEKIFRHTFDSFPEEQLRKSYACYLSTSAGPIMGVLYLSTVKLAFCSDNPLPYKVGDQTEWSYYKVVVPLHQMRSSSPSTNTTNSAEKYIQVVTADNHEFWFMGFLNYESAVEHLQEALREVQKT